MRKISKKTQGASALAIIFILVIVALLAKFEYKIKGPGRFVANAEWTLAQVEKDKLQSNLIYQNNAGNDQINLFHFDRPDYIHLALAPERAIGDRVQAGDVIAKLVSAEDEIRLAALQGELHQAQAKLATLNTGAKAALQQENQQALHYAKAELAAYEPVLKRQKALFEKQLVSEQELETTQAQYDLLKINVSLQQARLQAAKTGEKAEQIAVIEAEVQATAKKLAVFNKKLDAETVTSPISGLLVQPDRAAGELCHICALDTVVIQMPVQASEVQYLRNGMALKAFISGSKLNIITAVISSINRNAIEVNGRPMFLVTAVAANEDGRIFSGMTGYMAIHAGKIRVYTFLRRAFASFHFNK